jgi:hypothetical protein
MAAALATIGLALPIGLLIAPSVPEVFIAPHAEPSPSKGRAPATTGFQRRRGRKNMEAEADVQADGQSRGQILIVVTI